MSIRFIRDFTLSVWVWTLTLPALAEDAEESRAAAFRAVEGADAEQVPGGALLIAAYMVALILLVGYVARLGVMQQRTADEVQRLASAIAEREPKA